MKRVLFSALGLIAIVPIRMALMAILASGSAPFLTDMLVNAISVIFGICTAVVIWTLVKESPKAPSIMESPPDSSISVKPDKKQSPSDKEQQVKLSASKATGNIAKGFKKICLVCTQEFPDDYTGKCPKDGIELSRITDYLAPGTMFSEYYEIVAALGTGGLSNVFEVRHLSSGRHFAIKTLHSHLTNDPAQVQRFQREANALSKLSHPNLVSVEEFMISPSGIPFIVMELIDGESLEHYLKRIGHIGWQECARLFVEICKGLSQAHSRGIIHRDLKPGNIMLVTVDGVIVPKIVDFGLVKTTDPDSIGKITATGEIFGSPLYMSPEQCTGRPVDRRTDVYAMGCLLFECLTGQVPFRGKNVIDTLSMHLKDPVPLIPESLQVPAWMVEIVHTALKKDADQRFQSIDDLGGKLQDGLPIQRKIGRPKP